jgi:hypothetical protein
MNNMWPGDLAMDGPIGAARDGDEAGMNTGERSDERDA